MNAPLPGPSSANGRRPTLYRARCQKCGRQSREVAASNPGVKQIEVYYPEKGVATWSEGRTQPDFLPLVALCRDCLGLKRKEAAA